MQLPPEIKVETKSERNKNPLIISVSYTHLDVYKRQTNVRELINLKKEAKSAVLLVN